MKTQTDNSNIVVPENLEDTAKKWYGELKPGNTVYNRNYNSYVQGKRSAFKEGANWQKEQYKDLVQSHAELLAEVKSLKKICEQNIDEFNLPSLNLLLEKAEKINIQ